MISSLVPLLLVVIVVIGVLLVVAALRKHSSSEHDNDQPMRLELRKKRYFFSQAERSFYIALTDATKASSVTVMSKVRLNDLMDAVGDNKQGTNNRINRMHVDFVLLSQPNFQPLLAIELDGSSHANERQQTRDAKKDAAFKAAGLPLLRFPNGVAFAQVQTALEPYLNPSGSGDASQTPKLKPNNSKLETHRTP
jgi:very-short-patch-repair endonuclease